mmetsp:Transcript_16876/g.30237  ORF Transcript_16876/g.30237 Transcript_16876/m.30237 type:complete len:478 (+) Transcript_16876:121-1554(+)|eukprot:CAMPEP_0197534306 /NCGR_PEP_ID=MMETSP1318-20131121/46655_1 /TAXON_ID=552666 /ORGANISM="Partenskyella glossopodia, Strain RCC365" /LENGTH=477 /DNA_ID=CAMNT_0043091523 /DNA_START=118 /DNA_END=1551 /DNA_ORIENTATION=-
MPDAHCMPDAQRGQIKLSHQIPPNAVTGFLRKKCIRKVFGKHIWQKRFFVLDLDNESISYYAGSREGLSPIGVLPMQGVIDVQPENDEKKHGHQRFRIDLEGAWKFELRASSRAEKERWVITIKETIQKLRFRHVIARFKQVKYWKPAVFKKASEAIEEERKKTKRIYENSAKRMASAASARSTLYKEVEAAVDSFEAPKTPSKLKDSKSPRHSIKSPLGRDGNSVKTPTTRRSASGRTFREKRVSPRVRQRQPVASTGQPQVESSSSGEPVRGKQPAFRSRSGHQAAHAADLGKADSTFESKDGVPKVPRELSFGLGSKYVCKKRESFGLGSRYDKRGSLKPADYSISQVGSQVGPNHWGQKDLDSIIISKKHRKSLSAAGTNSPMMEGSSSEGKNKQHLGSKLDTGFLESEDSLPSSSPNGLWSSKNRNIVARRGTATQMKIPGAGAIDEMFNDATVTNNTGSARGQTKYNDVAY